MTTLRIFKTTVAIAAVINKNHIYIKEEKYYISINMVSIITKNVKQLLFLREKSRTKIKNEQLQDLKIDVQAIFRVKPLSFLKGKLGVQIEYERLQGLKIDVGIHFIFRVKSPSCKNDERK